MPSWESAPVGRPPLPIGTWGNISVKKSGKGFRARTLFRDFDGVTRPVERTGKTAGAARNALTAHLAERATPSGADLTGDSRLSEVVPVWLAEQETRLSKGNLALNTVRRYREVLQLHIEPALGNLRMYECTVSRLDAFVKAVDANVGSGTAKHCKVVLNGVMGLAARHGAVRTNPMRDVASVTVTKKEPRAMTLDEVAAFRRAAYVRQTTPRQGRHATDIVDVVDMFLATGGRVGETLALRWSDVDLDAGTVTISGTIVMSDSKPSRPMRQAFPKGKKPTTLLLPAFAVAMLLRRQVNAVPNVNDAVFPSMNGTWRDPGNLRKQLNKVRVDAQLEWVTPHSFRKTVATLLAEEADVATASAQLSHKSEDVTRAHYVVKPALAPDSRDVLQRFAPSDSP